jgi:2-dehydropantoate 2-reductase
VNKYSNLKKVLVFGVGVIGAYLVHSLSEAGNEVTVLVREDRAKMLNENGLRILHHLQRKETVDRVEAVSSIEGSHFDAAFVVMPWHKMRAALPQICAIQTELLVLVGNDLSSQEFHDYIREHSEAKTLLFGFQVSGGKKEKTRYICERLGAVSMDIGRLHGETDRETRHTVETLFSGAKYRLSWQPDMESFLVCHPAAILPIGYLAYICDGDMTSSTREQRQLMVDASREAYEFLKAQGITICPKGDEKFYEKGPRGALMRFLYFIMAKNKGIGDLIACEHCRNAVTEMEQIDLFYEELMKDYPKNKLQNWNELRGQMPTWESLHRKYGN